MKKGSTLFLKLVIICTGLAVLGIAGFLVPMEIMEGDGPAMIHYFWAVMYLTLIPFYIALYQGLKLLSSIDKNTAFSQTSVKALSVIKYCAISMTVLYLACYPTVFKIADLDDAPGLVLMWGAFACSPLVIAVFAALLQKLLNNVLEIKSENDLTV